MDDKFVFVVIAATLLIIILSVSSSIKQIQRDVARINVTVDRVAKQLGLQGTIPGNIDAELRSLISEGKKIEAIKKYRMATGLGLLEAKEYVDSLRKKI